jgi:RNA polymerase sigma-70 factor (ECF subfamily)
MDNHPTQTALQAVVVAAQSGDERAFHRLFDEHIDPLFRFLRRFSKSEDELDEWVQRAFIRAFEQIDRFDVTASFEPWLFQIAVNEMRMDRRREKIIPFVQLTDEERIPAGINEQFEWAITMQTTLATLDETKRLVFTLHEVEGFSHQEIAQMLSIRESHSRTILARTKQQLRTMLAAERKAL